MPRTKAMHPFWATSPEGVWLEVCALIGMSGKAGSLGGDGAGRRMSRAHSCPVPDTG
jgi:hypothetical protein